ncbi:MAG TPA: alpha-L-arabinofuranosidase C-terminal domain-containing protein [Candidatus Hydrogenedentes bacterium]|nr:alpha-L-arabinofuranosidase C-terminal domain-containing protein [Candidatus Hydrogenedentota bacterium]HOH50082.1 alpha-L-arabinofuranosidase C-terminal domain-containing protein [Candidatus Hydrogenedentota bacterium]HQL95063.1 alpha-L-arabinofuranosidase C-terminal domain-containing protein [Candidatus Hydrogenedentota bacterium]
MNIAAALLLLIAVPDMLAVDTTTVVRETSPDLWGVFFEEINHSGDGGLYAEMVRNRSFEDNQVPADCTADDTAFISPTGFRLEKGDQAAPLPGWKLVTQDAKARVLLDTGSPLAPQAPASARVTVESVGAGGWAGLMNGGFWGVHVRKGARYRLSLHARGEGVTLTAFLASRDGKRRYDTRLLGPVSDEWRRLEAVLSPAATDTDAVLVISAETPGVFSLDMVSLFPEETFLGRENGLRPDLAEMIGALKPAFIRFPGGCIVEGFTPETAWDWKETIGDPSARPGRQNLWGYRATDGLGYHEFLQFAEDIGAAPILVVNCGMTCQGRKPIFQPLEDMDRYVQDALDAVEYAIGGPETVWGARRAANGRPEPFDLRYITIGNENGGPEYQERYALFARAFREKQPDIRLISNSPVPGSPADYEEHHYYMTPQWFAANAEKYDTYDRTLPKVFVSEYAANTAAGKGNLEAAVGEAAFMIGLENNSDIVAMAAYAPLFCHENDRKWPVNLVVFDSHRVYGTPSWHVQKLFAENLPDRLHAVDYPRLGEEISLREGRIGVGTWRTRAEFKDIEVTGTGASPEPWRAADHPGDWTFFDGEWSVADGVLSQSDLGPNRVALTGSPDWTDCTLRFKARKLAGGEGFLVLFRASDSGTWHWINLGGWGNTAHGLESCVQGARFGESRRLPGKIETGRWYDIEVAVRGETVTVTLDGARVMAEPLPSLRSPGITANAGLDTETGDHIIKVSNFLDRAWETTVTLKGVSGPLEGTATVLSAAERTAENSLDHPGAVIPAVSVVRHPQGSFAHSFPACSVTVLRLHPAGRRSEARALLKM